jgi:hypothetical protein
MSRNQQIGLVVVALVVAVAAFVIARPSDDDDNSQPPAAKTEPDNGVTVGQSVDSGQITRIQVKGGVVVGDVKEIKAEKDEIVRIVVSSDAPDEIHLHGYDIEKEAAPGSPARFRFRADVEGAFELESHAAEDAGNEPLIARLLVGPS